MSNEMQFLIIVRFPEWSQVHHDGTLHKYKAYGRKYLFTMPIIPFPDWEDTDERWKTYDELKIVKDNFIKSFKASSRGEFKGEILFVEPADISEIKSVDL